MNTENQTVTGGSNASRVKWITNKANRVAKSQGYYSPEIAAGFIKYAIEHCPEVQGFTNLFDCYMSQLD